MATIVSQQSWLVLLPQLPAKPDYLRVKLQRRLARLGAVTVKNGVYALPLRDDTTEASEWLRSELVHDKGDLIVLGSVICAASPTTSSCSASWKAAAPGMTSSLPPGATHLATRAPICGAPTSRG